MEKGNSEMAILAEKIGTQLYSVYGYYYNTISCCVFLLLDEINLHIDNTQRELKKVVTAKQVHLSHTVTKTTFVVCVHLGWC